MRFKEFIIENDPTKQNQGPEKSGHRKHSGFSKTVSDNGNSQKRPQQEKLRQQNGDYTVNDKVKDLQSKLQKIGYNLGPPGVDGKYGPYTASAVKSFKNDYKVKGDPGAFGPNDQKVLNGVLSGKIPKVKTPSPSGTSSGPHKPLAAASGAVNSFKWKAGVDQRVKPEVLNKLMAVKNAFDISFTIVSGYRDPKRNKKAGGASKSAHITGDAVDVRFSGSKQDTVRFVELASRAGFGGIGVYRPGSVHLDIKNKRAWGPSFRFASVPSWVKGAIGAHLS